MPRTKADLQHPSEPKKPTGKDELTIEQVEEMSESERSLLPVTALPGYASFSRGMKSALEYIPTSKTFMEASTRAKLRTEYITETASQNKVFRFAVKIRKESRGKNAQPFADEELRVSKTFEFLEQVREGTVDADTEQLRASDLILKYSLSKTAQAKEPVPAGGPDDLGLGYGNGDK